MSVDFRDLCVQQYLMGRRLVALGVFAVLGGLAAFAGVIAPGQADAATGRVVEALAATPEPVVVVGSALLTTAVGVVLFVGLARTLYPVLRRVTRALLGVWDTALPESVIFRFGLGIIVMTVLFLVGPLVAIQALDIGGGEDPVERQVDTADDPGESTDNDTGGNGTNTTGTPDGPGEENTTEGDGDATGRTGG